MCTLCVSENVTTLKVKTSGASILVKRAGWLALNLIRLVYVCGPDMNHRKNSSYTQANKSGRANYTAHVCDHIALVRILYAIYSVEQ